MPRRLMTFMVGLFAGVLAVVCRLGGAFHDLDGKLFSFLGMPGDHPGIPLWIDLVCALLFAFGTALIAQQDTSRKARLGLLSATILQPISAVAVGLIAGYKISPFTWLTAILAAQLGMALYRFSTAGKRERLLRDIFGKHLSPSALEKLNQQPDALTARAVRATVLNARFIGEDWSQVEIMMDSLREKNAWVELQTGNHVLAVWNSPVTLGSPATAAMESTLGQMGHWQAGVATGEIVVERILSTNAWQMLGDVFDKAAALCQANAVFGSHILLDLETADAVRDGFILRPVELFIQPGTELGIEIFEPLAFTETASSETVTQRDQYWEAVIYFRQKRYSEALASFRKVGTDPVVQYYLKRLENLTSPS